MKNIALLLLLTAGMASGQTTKNLGDFDQLKVFDQIQVTLVQSDENKIELSGANSSEVEFVTKNNQLKIRLPFTRTLDGEKIKATLYFKSLNDIDGSEGASISGADVIKTANMTVTAKEGAQIDLNLEVGNLSIKSVTGGDIGLAGTADNMEASLGTGGILDARALVTRRTEIKINAGGEADVNATESVDASVKAGGNIRIYGNPKSVDQKTALGGSIEIKK